MAKTPAPFRPLNISVLTVSDTRSIAEDTSGDALIELLTKAGHKLNERTLVKDDVYQMRAVVSNWIADSETHVILITGGTGFYSRDSTPEAMTPLFDKTIEGFGELFRQISYTEIGTSTIQSRAIAGLANQTLVFCLPGSTGACKTAWNGILEEQLNASHRPCNFVSMLIGPYAENQHGA
ncbi:MAG: molybdenum cofactor biosynthesis protein B [Marinomonas foliarum]|jgi:molybdopterin adenylyltransferase|uniref:Molybdenum cofactor biosynthesis protein B n=1 Tax=Marinomonas foliarum TaxID=491950 RepID=A0A368ZL63_9GAMM|nr:molybdenum cofactor biosynthesis protein B [Marinomonas foliarum]RCW95033.1 molybdenum cofactor biosynthesis protein B [Marinomonas foliarum]